jgi:hypothetical protein
VGKTVAVVAGLVIAAIGEFIGMMLAGAGHGWTQPILYSLLLFLAWPAALLRIPRPEGISARFDLFMLVMGVTGSLLLFVQTANEPEYFWRMADQEEGVTVIIVWLLLWFGWQALTLVNIVRKRRLGRAG